MTFGNVYWIELISRNINEIAVCIIITYILLKKFKTKKSLVPIFKCITKINETTTFLTESQDIAKKIKINTARNKERLVELYQTEYCIELLSNVFLPMNIQNTVYFCRGLRVKKKKKTYCGSKTSLLPLGKVNCGVYF